MSAPPANLNLEGFFWCSRCTKVVEMSTGAVESALNAPIGSLRDLKCPGCHHHTVRWKVATALRPQHRDGWVIKPPLPPVDPERGRELFAQLKNLIL